MRFASVRFGSVWFSSNRDVNNSKRYGVSDVGGIWEITKFALIDKYDAKISTLSKLIATILSHSFTLAFSHPSFIAHLLSHSYSLSLSLPSSFSFYVCWKCCDAELKRACVRACVCKPIFFHFSFIPIIHIAAYNAHTHTHTPSHTNNFFSPFYAFIVGVMAEREAGRERMACFVSISVCWLFKWKIRRDNWFFVLFACWLCAVRSWLRQWCLLLSFHSNGIVTVLLFYGVNLWRSKQNSKQDAQAFKHFKKCRWRSAWFFDVEFSLFLSVWTRERNRMNNFHFIASIVHS